MYCTFMWSGIMLIDLNSLILTCVIFRHVHINCSKQLMEKLRSHWTDFHHIWYLSILGKCVKKAQVSLQSDKTFYMKTYVHL